MTGPAACPCEGFTHPLPVANPPGLAHVSYRASDFIAMRRALLRPLDATAFLRPPQPEASLSAWRPSARGDLLLQIVEWWAYISDILTLYGERSLNENLIATASLDESVRALVALLGYRPRPGIGASADLGVLLSAPGPLLLPAGFAVRSKPPPGQAPQTFETEAAVSVSRPDSVPARPLTGLLDASNALHLAGTVTVLAPGETLLLAAAEGSAAFPVEIVTVAFGTDSSNAAHTRIALKAAPAVPAGAVAAGYRLLRSARSVGLWKPTTTNAERISLSGASATLHLEQVDRAIAPGQRLVLVSPGGTPAAVAVTVTSSAEAIWYANGDGPTPPASLPIPALHSVLAVTSVDGAALSADWKTAATSLRLLVALEPAGSLRDAPAPSFGGTPATLLATSGRFRVGDAQPVLIEGADGTGLAATASVTAATPARLSLDAIATKPVPTLPTPLRVLHNRVRVTRGKSVPQEVLGTGDAAIAGQEFTLAKSPLTYLPHGDGYRSTLAVFVRGEQWTEVESFYGQPADARVFVTREDAERKTHVTFGDGADGARLPTGAPIVARYRVEADGESVPAGHLTVIDKPLPGVAALRQPLATTGGADPERMTQVRTLAPRSVLTFGRAISSDDYEVIAARAPGVRRVRSYFDWNATEQRATVTLYVGDDEAAVTSARAALAQSADPNRTVTVLPATRVTAQLGIGLLLDAGRLAEDVTAAVRIALCDPDSGIFGPRRLRIGQGIFRSRVSDACLAIPGVRSVRFALFLLSRPDLVTGSTLVGSPHIWAAANEYFALPPENLYLLTAEADDD